MRESRDACSCSAHCNTGVLHKKLIRSARKSCLSLPNMWTKPPICDKSRKHGDSDYPTTICIEVLQHKENKSVMVVERATGRVDSRSQSLGWSNRDSWLSVTALYGWQCLATANNFCLHHEWTFCAKPCKSNKFLRTYLCIPAQGHGSTELDVAHVQLGPCFSFLKKSNIYFNGEY